MDAESLDEEEVTKVRTVNYVVPKELFNCVIVYKDTHRYECDAVSLYHHATCYQDIIRSRENKQDGIVILTLSDCTLTPKQMEKWLVFVHDSDKQSVVRDGTWPQLLDAYRYFNDRVYETKLRDFFSFGNIVEEVKALDVHQLQILQKAGLINQVFRCYTFLDKLQYALKIAKVDTYEPFAELITNFSKMLEQISVTNRLIEQSVNPQVAVNLSNSLNKCLMYSLSPALIIHSHIDNNSITEKPDAVKKHVVFALMDAYSSTELHNVLHSGGGRKWQRFIHLYATHARDAYKTELEACEACMHDVRDVEDQNRHEAMEMERAPPLRLTYLLMP